MENTVANVQIGAGTYCQNTGIFTGTIIAKGSAYKLLQLGYNFSEQWLDQQAQNFGPYEYLHNSWVAVKLHGCIQILHYSREFHNSVFILPPQQV